MSLLLAFAGLTAFGQLASGYMAQQESNRRAEYDRKRAQIARDQAQAEVRTRARRNIRARGREMAAMAQSGFTTGGNFVDLLEQSDIDREMDLLNTEYRGEVNAFGLESQAALDIEAGKNAMLGGILGAAGTLGSAYIGSRTPKSAIGRGSSRGYASGGMINPSGTGPI